MLKQDLKHKAKQETSWWISSLLSNLQSVLWQADLSSLKNPPSLPVQEYWDQLICVITLLRTIQKISIRKLINTMSTSSYYSCLKIMTSNDSYRDMKQVNQNWSNSLQFFWCFKNYFFQKWQVWLFSNHNHI